MYGKCMSYNETSINTAKEIALHKQVNLNIGRTILQMYNMYESKPYIYSIQP